MALPRFPFAEHLENLECVRAFQLQANLGSRQPRHEWYPDVVVLILLGMESIMMFIMNATRLYLCETETVMRDRDNSEPDALLVGTKITPDNFTSNTREERLERLLRPSNCHQKISWSRV
jgi:hypothetical protein